MMSKISYRNKSSKYKAKLKRNEDGVLKTIHCTYPGIVISLPFTKMTMTTNTNSRRP